MKAWASNDLFYTFSLSIDICDQLVHADTAVMDEPLAGLPPLADESDQSDQKLGDCGVVNTLMVGPSSGFGAETAGSLLDARLANGTETGIEPAPDTGGGRGRRRRILISASVSMAVAGALLVTGWLVARRTQSPEQAAADAAPPKASWVTAKVEFRVLSRTVITRGDVRSEVTVDVGVPASVQGDPVVTEVDVAVGDEVGEGTRVIEVSGRPIFVLQGGVPVYRTLRPGASGTDVAALQAALGRLGFEPDTDGVFGAATAAAVTEFYEQAGYEPVPASTTETADLADAEQRVTDAEQAVTSAQRAVAEASLAGSGSALAQVEAAVNEATRALARAESARVSQVVLSQQALDLAIAERDRLGADPESTPGAWDQAQLAVNQARAQLDDTRQTTNDAVEAAKEALWIAALARNEALASADTTEALQELRAAEATLEQAVAARSVLLAASGASVPQGEILFVPALPARVQNAVTTLGAAGAAPDQSAGQTLVELAGGRLVVDATFRPNEEDLLQVGTRVELRDELTDAAYPAAVTDIATDRGSGLDGELGYRAIIKSDEEMPANLAGANLRVTITAASTSTPALIVPLAAISSAADGSTSVHLLRTDGEPEVVAVDTGLSADGWVAITPVAPDTLRGGDEVIVGR